MPYEIGPLRPEDLPALGRFLAEGFGAPSDAEFAAPDVLRWKYLDPRPGDDRPRSLVARDEAGAIVGHLGLATTAWHVAGSDRPPVSTLHMLDWLAGAGQKGGGAALMRRANTLTATQYAFGGSDIARRVMARAGYEPRPPVPVFRRVLRPSYRLREPGILPGRLARTLRDVARTLRDRPAGAEAAWRLRSVERFGPEVTDLLAACRGPLAFTDRGPDILNALLAYPRGGPAGYQIERDGRPDGFAVLNVVRSGRVRIGKVVELFRPDRDPAAWRSALLALTAELGRLGADVAFTCGPTPWEVEALRGAGFRRAYDVDFKIRDRGGLLPRDVPHHLSFLDADYAVLA